MIMRKNRGDNNNEKWKNAMRNTSIDNLVTESIKALPAELQQRAVPVWYKSNHEIIHKGEKTEYVYLMLLGDTVVLNELENGNYYSFAHIRAGRYICDLELLSGRLFAAATVLSVTDCFLLRFELSDFMHCLESDIEFLRTFARGFANAIFATSDERGHNHYRLGIDKMVRYLVKYYGTYSVIGSSDVVVNVTRQNIASEIGINVKTVNRSISNLKAGNMVHMSGRKLCISQAEFELLTERLERYDQ